MKKILTILLLGFSGLLNAQTQQTTPNLITSGTTHTWYGVTTGTIPSDYMPPGSTSAPRYDPNTNSISFSYGNASIGQTYAVNQALANVGAGVKINGYTYSYDVRNMNGDDRQGGVDAFTVSQLLRGPQNSVLLSSSQYHNTKFEWKTVTGTKTTSTPYEIIDTSYIQFGVSGADNGYWGGYFGPQIRNVDMRLNYTVDPCATNPAYSPMCANYNTVSTQNVFSGLTGAQAYAINQALEGSGVMVHGFNYGYNYNVGNRYCNFIDIFGGCIGTWIYPSASVNTTITDNNSQNIWNETNNHVAGASGTYSKELRFGASRPITTMGTFTMTPTATSRATIDNMYSTIVYTPDPCVINPLSATSCSGYQQAYTDLQCSSNPLYSTSCSGYQQAYFTQQCNANQLYNPGCPGYASAYLTYQCNANPLYSTTCPGYTEAYTNQQCGISPLYSQSCSGYRAAYHDQQCSTNPLYATDCIGYDAAYLSQQCGANQLYSTTCSGYAVAYKGQQCALNQLYATDCPGYQTAYKAQQCSLNQLYATDCPGYQTTYFNQQCGLSSLYNSMCPGYEQAYLNQQCAINQLYSSQCTGYTQAYHDQQCATNQLYASTCSGYTVAYKAQQCGLSSLYATDCPGYDAAYKAQQCSINTLYATDCPGYAVAYKATLCAANPLYATDCPGYAKAYALQNVITVTPVISTSNVNTTNTNDVASAAVAIVSDPVVNQTLTTTSTSASPATSATAAVSLVSVSQPNAGVSNVIAPSVSTGAVATPPPPENKPSGPTARQELAAKREAQAKAKAVEEGKNLANDMGKVADMESQKQIQNVVIQAMGFTPGFDKYNVMMTDGNMYKPFTVYKNQVNVDNARLGRRMYGPSDALHTEMINMQWVPE